MTLQEQIAEDVARKKAFVAYKFVNCYLPTLAYRHESCTMGDLAAVDIDKVTRMRLYKAIDAALDYLLAYFAEKPAD
jgi:hypothetical protein